MSATPVLHGLHHITAITARASENVAFYTGVLGLRLVKKTVNQDDVTAYHLFYGDETGGPGTEITFFHWPNAPRDVRGTGTVSLISLAVPDAASLNWWHDRLQGLGVRTTGLQDRRGRAALAFTDPEGQHLELVDAPGAEDRWGRPWSAGPVPPEVAVRGLFGVTLTVADARPTLTVMTQLLDFRRTAQYADPEGSTVTVLEVGEGGPGTEVRVAVPATPRRGHPGIGGVHHVALRTPDDAAQSAWLQRLNSVGVPNSSIVDRYYFKSLYFREPGGVLLEIATDGPGFATDEPLEHLGERLALPPFLEPQRAQIEAALTPLAPAGVTRDG